MSIVDHGSSEYGTQKTRVRFNKRGHAHFLTFSCFQRRPFLRSERPLAWLGESVGHACIKYDYALWGFVFMPEHVHLLVRPRQAKYSISAFLQSLKLSLVRKVLYYKAVTPKPETAWEPFIDPQPNGQSHFRFWQRGGGHDRNVRDTQDLAQILAYMHNNPPTRGLCVEPTDWKWSSAAFYAGLRQSPLLVEDYRKQTASMDHKAI